MAPIMAPVLRHAACRRYNAGAGRIVAESTRAQGSRRLARGELIVHRASRIERLAELLAGHLEAEQPANPLAAQSVVVAHAGMKRWLLGLLARRRPAAGGHGIAANFEMILPWQWLERSAHELLGDEALVGGPWRQEVLRWHILAALRGFDAPELGLDGDGAEAAQRRFQLAQRMAGVYAQYLIYRPEWIRAWEQGEAARDWQARLWRRVRAAIERPHRAQRGPDLLRALAADAATPRAPLHVFGVSRLAPDELEALRVRALHARVHLYFPDPCREHWSYLRARRELLRIEGDAEALYFEVGHPLLVALGRVAQDFCLALDEIDASEQRDALDDADEADAAAPLLQRVQSSLRRMQPDAIGGHFREDAAGAPLEARLLPLRADASLRVHACHTRLRELEVLRDALLRCLADEPGLRHREIVVMAPDIAAYAPYLRAVFGEPASYRHDPLHIPWHLADVDLARAHPLLGAVTRLLDLAESRFEASDVLGLLDVPAFARRFAIDDEAREALERWLRGARVAWGLDAAMKAAAGAAAIEANSWRFGLDRMYAGLVAGNEADAVLPGGIVPLAGVGGGEVDAIGQLDHLLLELRQFREGLAQPRTLGDWCAWFGDRIDALFEADPRDETEAAAFDALRRVIGELAGEGVQAMPDEPQPWSVVREALAGALAAVPERQPFLLGGVTFCGLVPQRSIPFRMVCLLGMNEGEFPRAGGDAGLNRMLAAPRRGDRDTRGEDRYLFLEALMAARTRLHLSYVGVAVKDGKTRNPASPLAELLQLLDEQFGIAADSAIDRPWRIVHPLQPFDPRYYERADAGIGSRDPRLYSYDATFLPRAQPAARPSRFLEPQAPAAPSAQGEFALDALLRFWRDPVRSALRDGIGIDLEAADGESWPDREPLTPGVDPRERFEYRLLFDALERGTALPAEAPAWLAHSGLLAAGAPGELAYAAAVEQVAPVLAAARDLLMHGALQRDAQAVDLDLGDGLRLVGRVDRLFRTRDGGWLLFDAQPRRESGLREWLGFHVEWAALRLALGTRVDAAYIESGRTGPRAPAWLDVLRTHDETGLRRGLRRLVELWRAAAQQPLLYFPKTAWTWAGAAADRREAQARDQWEGSGFGQGERDFAPGYARLATRGLDLFAANDPAHAAFVQAVDFVAEVLDPHRVLLFVQGEGGASPSSARGAAGGDS